MYITSLFFKSIIEFIIAVAEYTPMVLWNKVLEFGQYNSLLNINKHHRFLFLYLQVLIYPLNVFQIPMNPC